MFAGAMTCLVIAFFAAICGYCGMPDIAVARLAQHIFLVAIAGFAIGAIVAIADFGELLPARTHFGKPQAKFINAD